MAGNLKTYNDNSGQTQWAFNAAPWMMNPTDWRNVFNANAQYITTTLGTSRGGFDGAAFPAGNNWIQAVNNNSDQISATGIWQAHFNSRVGCAFMNGGTAIAKCDPIGVAQSGTAVPFTIILAGQIPVAPGVTWRLANFGRSSSGTPLIDIGQGAAGSTVMTINRRNDANNLSVSAATIDPGTNPFILFVQYTGTTLTTRLNGIVKDNAIAFNGGALTLNQFTLGALRTTATSGFSNPKITHLLYNNTVVAQSVWQKYENYIRRRIGV